jgi:outer membrane protein assembly factor BamA
MALVWTIGLVGTIGLAVLLIAFRLLLPPVPQVARLSRMFGKRTVLLLCSVALAGAMALVVLSKPRPNIIEGVEFRGARRIPQDTLRAMIFSKVGDVYKQETLRLDVAVLRITDRFEDVRVSTEEGKRGGIVLRFVVIERPPI